jgi:hypothetical protein
MKSMRSTWTDSRLDDLANRTDSRLDDLANRMDAGFARVDGDLRDLRGEMSAMQRTMVQTTVALAVGMLAGFGGLAGLIATQI